MGARASEVLQHIPVTNREECTGIDDGYPDDKPVTVRLPKNRMPRTKMFRQLPYGHFPGFAPICGDTADPDTVLQGLRKRLFRDLPVPKTTGKYTIAGLSRFVHDYVQDITPLTNIKSFEQWLATTNYSENRKQQLRASNEALRGGPPTNKQLHQVKTHVKRENYPEFKNIRTINSRCDAFKVYAGPAFAAMDAAMYAIPNDAHGGYLTINFVKHLTPEQRAERVHSLKGRFKNCYETDFTAFESHFTPALMKAVELQLYKRLLLNYPDMYARIEQALIGINNCSTHHGIRFKIRAKRMSGDMCTSLGNGFTNLMLALYIAHTQGKTIDGIVEGDDGLFSTDAEFTTDIYADLGFTIKIVRHDSPLEASFCGIVCSEDFQNIKNPHKVLEKFGWTANLIHAGPQILNELLAAKSLSLLYEMPHCPIIGALARKAITMVPPGTMPRFDNSYKTTPEYFDIPPFAPTIATRELFERKFNISISEQLACEEAIERDRPIPLQPNNDTLAYATNYIEVS